MGHGRNVDSEIVVNVLAFDIETVPDVSFGRQLLGIESLSDEAVANAMFARRRQQTGSEFLPLEQHRIVAIAVALKHNGRLSVWSLGEEQASEVELITRFFEGIERYTPNLVSWNGGGFDLPVLHYRALRHGVVAERYWETGDNDSSFRYNNYLNRFHSRHTDLMDVLSGYQMRGVVSLERMALLCGFPGKLGMSGDAVWPSYLNAQLAKIRAYCETDVVNTYLIYLRYERMRGHLSEKEYHLECERVRRTLEGLNGAHWAQFLAAWRNEDGTNMDAGRGASS